jgi:hypothetical protein
MTLSSNVQNSAQTAPAASLSDLQQATRLDEQIQQAQWDQRWHKQRRRCQSVLQAIAQVNIVLDDTGVRLIAPSSDVNDAEVWEASDRYAKDFLQLPPDFARSYLRLRLRNFLYETFCLAPASVSASVPVSVNESDQAVAQPPATWANDRVSGDLHVGLLKLFPQSNCGKGYFDPGWQVVEAPADEPAAAENRLCVKKHDVVVQVERSRHLMLAERAAQLGDMVSVYLPPYRFEPGCYVAVGDRGPVADLSQAVDIYFAANAAAMAAIMQAITAALNANEPSDEAIPYTLQVPCEPEGYVGPEAIVLRVDITAHAKVRPVLQQIWQIGQAADPNSHLTGEALDLAAPPQLRPDWPVFAYPLWPGISVAKAIASTATYWYGGSADLSRMQLAADALLHSWYLGESRLEESMMAANLAAMQAQFTQAELSWQEPYRAADGRERDWFE